MIFTQLSEQLQSLIKLMLSLDDEQYNKKIEHLGNASIGGHTRHIIELLQCAIDGHQSGEVDYINRSRNLLLETDRAFAQVTLQRLDETIRLSDKELMLLTEQQSLNVTTTYFREVVYNTEHTIHHLALIKVAIIEMKLEVADNNFGMAYSTIKYKASLNKA
jgi:hypothetical protein